ncbi:MAG TPA: hypothetical protein VMH48_02145 [Methylomirabilota bacterium]|nr:hypothetical protein [Methylomirabilota bacterium]
MGKNRNLEILHAISCLLCFIVASTRLDDIGASEFIGGWLTGPIFRMADAGSILFLLALPLAFFFRRVAAAAALAASILSLPLYLYFTAPGAFRWVFKGEYSVPLQASFIWNTWAITGILFVLLAIVVSLRRLAPNGPESIPNPVNRETA